MAITPPRESIRGFESARAFEAWLSKNHDEAREIYLRIYKKGSGKKTVTYAEALDVALCWGWIDGLKKAYDAESFLQRFTPRRPKSVWSSINRQHVERLIASGRMTPHGLEHVEAAKADGRWASAYGSGKTLAAPPELLAAIAREPKAQKTYDSLDKTNLYALAWRVHTLKTAAGRAKRIAAFVEMLKRGEAPHPIKKKK